MILNDIFLGRPKEFGEVFYWDKDVSYHPKGLDLKDVYLNWKITTLDELDDYLKFGNYKENKKVIQNILKSYKVCDISYSKYKFSALFPDNIWKKYLKSRQDLLFLALENIKQKAWFDDVKDFFIHKSSTKVKKYFNFVLQTKNKKERVNLDFGANFRFKAKPDTLNIFNMAKFFRKNIIPLNENSVIFACDFKQFEFRTYLDIHPDISINFDESNLYDSFSQKYIPEVKDYKVSIISYLYGKSNPKLDLVLAKAKILDRIEDDEIFWHENMPVLLEASQEPYKKIHTIVQTISQYRMLNKIQQILILLKGYKSKLIYPFHDELIFSVEKNEKRELTQKILDILNDDVYKVHKFEGLNFLEMKEYD